MTMKKQFFKFRLVLIITLTQVLAVTSVWAQSPAKMSYQAVIRDADNELITNQLVGIKLSILQGSPIGSEVFTEEQTPLTNANGLISIIIGDTGIDLNSIDWGEGPYYIKIDTDPAGGTNYTITGTSQLLSVPYALHAKTAETVLGGGGGESLWSFGSNVIYNTNDYYVGIGTSQPEAPLHVLDRAIFGNLHKVSIGFDLVGNEIGLLDETDRLIAGKPNVSQNNLYQYGGVPGSQEGIFVNNGNVGIGTSSPAEKLHIQNTGGNTSAKIGYTHTYFDNRLFFGDDSYVWVGEYGADDRLSLSAGSMSIDINGSTGAAGQVLAATGSGTATWQPAVAPTAGTILYWNGTAWVNIPAGTTGQVLTYVNGVPTWLGTGAGTNDVFNPTTGRVWMDRNLGASQVATSSTDAASYGDLYQWGRGNDGHQSRTSGTTTTLSSSNSPGHGNFILAPSSPYDWRNPQNDNLWQGVSGVNTVYPLKRSGMQSA